MYFQAPYTDQNIKKQYKEYAKKLHPDAGGDETEFKLMKYEYDELMKLIPKQPKTPEKVYVVKRKSNTMEHHIKIDESVIELFKQLKKIFK